MAGRIIAIGDIHGCCKTFTKLLLEKLQVQPEDEIYCLGDFIDRGMDSRGVVDLIIELRQNGYHIHTLRGNHEQLMLDAVTDESCFDDWLHLGGNHTLKSFGVTKYIELQPQYRQFFESTAFYLTFENYIFVHAGLNFQNDHIFEDKHAMLWIRNFAIDTEKLGNRLLIHGHQPLPLDVLLQQPLSQVVNIDGGCVYKHSGSMGNLVALNLSSGEYIVQPNCE